MKSGFLCCAIVAMFGCLASPARAAEDDAFHINITPYLWVPSLDTQLQVKDVPVEVENSTGTFDVLDAIDMVFLVAGEVRKDKLGVVYDFEYLKLSQDGEVAFGENREFSSGLKIAIFTLGLEYRLIDDPKFSLDAIAGGRLMYADVSIDIEAGRLGREREGSQSKTWVDPIVGAKFGWRFAKSWSLNGYGDIGGFGVSSDLTYTLTGTIAYHFNKNLALQAGYRYFAVDFKEGDFKFDTKFYGPVIGLTFSF